MISNLKSRQHRPDCHTMTSRTSPRRIAMASLVYAGNLAVVLDKQLV